MLIPARPARVFPTAGRAGTMGARPGGPRAARGKVRTVAERVDRWPPGAPCWADLMVSDLDRSEDFYATVLGWRFTPSDPAFGGYCNALVAGEPVAGLSPGLPGAEDDPHAWAVYLASDDLAATGRAAVAAGARPVLEPVRVGDFGSMGVWADPTGAAFGVWQPGRHTGFSVVGGHGTVAWCELMTRDQRAAERFYAAVFGYAYRELGTRHEAYAAFTVPGSERGGGIGVPAPDVDPLREAPPMWWVCFEVDDAETAAEAVVAAGGSLLGEPEEFGYGELVLAAGPDGERFAMTGPRSEDWDDHSWSRKLRR